MPECRCTCCVAQDTSRHCLKNSQTVAKRVVKCNLKQHKHKAKPAAAATEGVRRSSKGTTRQGCGSAELRGWAWLNEVRVGPAAAVARVRGTVRE